MSQLANTQHNPSDISHSRLKPHEYWNLYIRLEGEAPLDELQYKKMMANQPFFTESKNRVIEKITRQKLIKTDAYLRSK